ncbi:MULTISPECIES: DUF2164 domain-containing protein [unclassified Devosia]|nr:MULTISPECIES: DUF2164 domain-containing protein [unclassified Devosia]MBJ6988314.1 DUF2164 domain-containing protein [Devosia sp. MC521]MBJ7577520.1 DUF2164 domain-containing protein [Devosia sp. MC532]MBK1794575.1 DUF2164 domain-containing protein [Devosia sp. WQ 349K1]QMW63180.1 DUF2164 domain-containing protein [Devosia sp. MC521]
MKPIKFERDEMKIIVAEVQDYFQNELDSNIGSIPAELLVQFFAEKIGAHYYNRGLHDAQALVRKKIDDVSDEIFSLEKTTRTRR